VLISLARIKQSNANQQIKYPGCRIFRAPEILMGTDQITKASDMWSAGLILLSILAGRFPIFEDLPEETDCKASFYVLSQIIVLRGIHKIISLANSMQKILDTNLQSNEISLKDFCNRSRNNALLEQLDVPLSLYDLLENCLQVDPRHRILAQQIETHSYFSSHQ